MLKKIIFSRTECRFMKLKKSLFIVFSFLFSILYYSCLSSKSSFSYEPDFTGAFSVKDTRILSAVSAASERSIRYGYYFYVIFNVCDLGTFITNCSELFPAETKKNLAALDEAVIYVRNTSYLICLLK